MFSLTDCDSMIDYCKPVFIFEKKEFKKFTSWKLRKEHEKKIKHEKALSVCLNNYIAGHQSHQQCLSTLTRSPICIHFILLKRTFDHLLLLVIGFSGYCPLLHEMHRIHEVDNSVWLSDQTIYLFIVYTYRQMYKIYSLGLLGLLHQYVDDLLI